MTTLAEVLIAPFLAAAALLVVAGAPKVRDPGDLVRALRSARMPARRPWVRGFALAEVVVGLVALAVPGRVAASLLAVLYAAFTGFVAVALRRGGVLSSCGCFGRADTPPTWSHAVVTGGAALVGVAVAAGAPASPWAGGAAASAVGTVALAALVGFLAWQVMAVLPSVDVRAVRSAGTVPSVPSRPSPGGA
jgi:hypothetical protein